MPIYEYVCSKCKHELEALQKVSDAPLVECPHCHAATLAKKVSAPPFHLKGTGWYATDFRNNDKKVTTKKTDSSDQKTSDKDSSDTAAPAPTTPPKTDES